MRRKCVKSTGASALMQICFGCESVPIARQTAAEMEALGYDVRLGWCSGCLTRFAMDSVRGSHWQLAGT